MNKIIALLALPLVACTIQPAPTNPLTDSAWRFVAIDGAAPVSPKASLSFRKDGISATVGCNGMGGNWRMEKNRLIAGPLMQTEMYCEGPIWGQEQALSALLVAAPIVTLDNKRLMLKASGHSAELERITPRD